MNVTGYKTRNSIISQISISRYSPRILLAVSVKNGDAIRVKAISHPEITLGLPKSDQIHFSMRRSSIVLDLWSNFELSLTKNHA